MNRQETERTNYGEGESEREPAVSPRPQNKEKNGEEYGERGIGLGAPLRLPKKGLHSYSEEDRGSPPRVLRREQTDCSN